MNYQVYAASPDLQPFIKCFWSLDDEGTVEIKRQRVVPDGCIEMIFHYGDLYRQYFEDGAYITQPRSFVFGQITNYIEIAPTGKTGLVAARFQPGGLLPFVDIKIDMLKNKAVDIATLFGEKGRLLEAQVTSAGDNNHRISLIEAFLFSCLTNPNTVDNILRACVNAILESQGQTDVATLARQMKVNRRKIERKFAAAIGMPPKQLLRVVRLQTTLRMMEQKVFTSLTSLAHENGYYDQAHFIKDFKEFSGLSPKSFYSGNLKFAALFASAD